MSAEDNEQPESKMIDIQVLQPRKEPAIKEVKIDHAKLQTWALKRLMGE